MSGPPRMTAEQGAATGRHAQLFCPPGRHLEHLNSPYLVNIHHLTGDSKNGLNVVFGKFLDQLANRWVVLGVERDTALSMISPSSGRVDSFGFAAQIMMIMVTLWSQQQAFYATFFFCLVEQGLRVQSC